ncbi:MAG: hypothetical protein KC910_37695 [Candidatus Eremiobacteraeota bacterium]|nr:hypothetical protein [Candidatus Eremiobacteraeota bacterium]
MVATAWLVRPPVEVVAAESIVWSGIEVPVPRVEGMVCPNCRSRRAQPVAQVHHSCVPESPQEVHQREVEEAQLTAAGYIVEKHQCFIGWPYHDWKCLDCGSFYNLHHFLLD